jgi:hypothetical protein
MGKQRRSGMMSGMGMTLALKGFQSFLVTVMIKN